MAQESCTSLLWQITWTKLKKLYLKFFYLMYPDVKWSILAVEWNWDCFNTFIFSRSIILLWVCQKWFISWWYISSTFICKSTYLHFTTFSICQEEIAFAKILISYTHQYEEIWQNGIFFPTFNWGSSSYFHKRWLFPPFSYCGKIQHFGSFWPKDHILFHGLWCRENGQILNEWSNLAPKSLVCGILYVTFYPIT